jgi:hypothetical protein
MYSTAPERCASTAARDGAVRADGLYFANVRVVGAQQAAITEPSGGSVVDSEARTAITAILDALQAHGLTL